MLSPSSRVKITAICKVKGEGKGSEVESQNGMDKFGNSYCVVWESTLSRVTVCVKLATFNSIQRKAINQKYFNGSVASVPGEYRELTLLTSVTLLRF